MIAKTFSSSMSCLVKEIAFSGLAAESLMISSILLPLIPPLLFTSSTSISRVRASGPPRKEAPPVTARTAPILMFSARAGTAQRLTAITAMRSLDANFFIFFSRSNKKEYRSTTAVPLNNYSGSAPKVITHKYLLH